MRVWIVEDQDEGSLAASVVKVFDNLSAAQQWIEDPSEPAFGHYALAAPLGWDGTDEGAAFTVEDRS